MVETSVLLLSAGMLFTTERNLVYHALYGESTMFWRV